MRLVVAALALVVAASAAGAAPAAPSRADTPNTPAFARRDDAFLRAYSVTVDAPVVHIPRCSDVDAFEGQLAFANVDVTAHVPFPDVDRHGRYVGRTHFSIRRVTLHLPADILWPGMTERDRSAVTASLAALRHHEVGHVRVAAAEVARLNAAPLTVTPDAEVYRQS